ncbi:hypothetical protein KEJ27_09750 [Candidatus Bathyarchaeota archaeon]|nr:hypothetical protein [Candidatus Bathyarchaeota archaeon]
MIVKYAGLGVEADIRSEVDEHWRRVDKLEEELKLLREKLSELYGKFKEAISYSIICSSLIAIRLARLEAFAERFATMKAGRREEKLMDFLKEAKENHDGTFESLKCIDKNLAELFSEIHLKGISISLILWMWRRVGDRLETFLDALVKVLGPASLDLVDEKDILDLYGIEGLGLFRKAKELTRGGR